MRITLWNGLSTPNLAAYWDRWAAHTQRRFIAHKIRLLEKALPAGGRVRWHCDLESGCSEGLDVQGLVMCGLNFPAGSNKGGAEGNGSGGAGGVNRQPSEMESDVLLQPGTAVSYDTKYQSSEFPRVGPGKYSKSGMHVQWMHCVSRGKPNGPVPETLQFGVETPAHLCETRRYGILGVESILPSGKRKKHITCEGRSSHAPSHIVSFMDSVWYTTTKKQTCSHAVGQTWGRIRINRW